MKISVSLVTLGALLILGGPAANAITVPFSVTFDPPPIQAPGYTPGYDQFSYTFTVNGTNYLTDGDYFTISGISGLFNALSPADFTATANRGTGGATGYVTFTYDGDVPTSAEFSEDGFEINTYPGYTSVTDGSYTGVVTPSFAPSFAADMVESVSSSGTVPVPAADASPVPEPGSGELLGLGLMALGIAKSRAGSFLRRSSSH
jgi:hypothetical protein